MRNKYFIVSDAGTGRIIITKNYYEIYDFIVYNTNSKIRTIGVDVKPKIMDKRTFLSLFLKNTTNRNKFYELAKILIIGRSNIFPYLKSMNLMEEYRYYMSHKNNVL